MPIDIRAFFGVSFEEWDEDEFTSFFFSLCLSNSLILVIFSSLSDEVWSDYSLLLLLSESLSYCIFKSSSAI